MTRDPAGAAPAVPGRRLTAVQDPAGAALAVPGGWPTAARDPAGALQRYLADGPLLYGILLGPLQP